MHLLRLDQFVGMLSEVGDLVGGHVATARLEDEPEERPRVELAVHDCLLAHVSLSTRVQLVARRFQWSRRDHTPR